jgi:hypothetical protein
VRPGPPEELSQLNTDVEAGDAEGPIGITCPNLYLPDSLWRRLLRYFINCSAEPRLWPAP